MVFASDSISDEARNRLARTGTTIFDKVPLHKMREISSRFDVPITNFDQGEGASLGLCCSFVKQRAGPKLTMVSIATFDRGRYLCKSINYRPLRVTYPLHREANPPQRFLPEFQLSEQDEQDGREEFEAFQDYLLEPGDNCIYEVRKENYLLKL